MRKKLFKSALGTIACVGLLAGNANALLLDFTDSSNSSLFEGTQSSVSIAYGSFGVTLTSYINGTESDDLTFNGHEGPGEIQIGTQMLAGDGDGIGINDDEISNGQMLEVAFDPAVTVKAIYFLDLFASESEVSLIKYNSDNSSWATLTGGGFDYGYVEAGHNANNIVTLELAPQSDGGTSDFSLAGIDVTPVPEPATMLLFGTGLAGIASLRRKMKK